MDSLRRDAMFHVKHIDVLSAFPESDSFFARHYSVVVSNKSCRNEKLRTIRYDLTNTASIDKLVPMDTLEQRLVERLHKAGMNLVYVCAGAGTSAMTSLFSVPGASNTVLECLVPYSHPAFDAFLGRQPEKYVSERSALQLAGRALTRAQLLAEGDAHLIGVACTAAIVTTEEKRGKHRAYIATWHEDRVVSSYFELEKGARSRIEEETVVSQLVLNQIARAAGLEERMPVAFKDGESVHEVCYDIAASAEKIYQQEIAYFGVHDFGRIRFNDANPQVLLPGSFNPLHDGHIALAKAASNHLGKPIAFELSAINVDKPALPKAEALSRLAQFAGYFSVYLTNAPTFLEKSRIFPDTTFVIGFDTAARILMPRYYQNDASLMLNALAEMKERRITFLVAPRVDDAGSIQTVDNLIIPESFENMFVGLPDFRRDISSTQLRAIGSRGSR